MAALKDWGFAPGGGRNPAVSGPGAQSERLRRMFTRLLNSDGSLVTGLIDRPGVDAVHDFIATILNDATIDKPIGNAFIGAHADSEGDIFISMFADQQNVVDNIAAGQTNFEVLVATEDAAAPQQSINMDDILDDSGDHFVHFKGCNIGKQPKFLNKFKEALDADGVTAPKFFHGLFWDAAAGVFEFMAYEFVAFQKTPFTSRADLITALKAGGVTFIDGSLPQDSDWNSWVPKNISRSKNTTVKLSLGQTVGGRSELRIDRQFRVESTQRHPFSWSISGLTPFPAKSAFLSTLRDSITTAEEFTTNGFPFHERWGYPDANAFVDGLNWTFRRGTKADANTLFATGNRNIVTLVVPITDPSTGNLVFNFHPHDPTTVTPVIQMDETDSTFFGIV